MHKEPQILPENYNHRYGPQLQSVLGNSFSETLHMHDTVTSIAHLEVSMSVNSSLFSFLPYAILFVYFHELI